MTIIDIPYANDQVWGFQPRDYSWFMKDAILDWHNLQDIPLRCYQNAVCMEEDDLHGIFLFEDPNHAMLFKLAWV